MRIIHFCMNCERFFERKIKKWKVVKNPSSKERFECLRKNNYIKKCPDCKQY